MDLVLIEMQFDAPFLVTQIWPLPKMMTEFSSGLHISSSAVHSFLLRDLRSFGGPVASRPISFDDFTGQLQLRSKSSEGSFLSDSLECFT